MIWKRRRHYADFLPFDRWLNSTHTFLKKILQCTKIKQLLTLRQCNIWRAGDVRSVVASGCGTLAAAAVIRAFGNEKMYSFIAWYQFQLFILSNEIIFRLWSCVKIAVVSSKHRTIHATQTQQSRLVGSVVTPWPFRKTMVSGEFIFWPPGSFVPAYFLLDQPTKFWGLKGVLIDAHMRFLPPYCPLIAPWIMPGQ